MKSLDRYAATIPLVLAGALIAGYAYFQMVRVLNGTTLSVQEPGAGTTSATPLITITGEANHAAFVSVNDREILTDESGHFAEKVLLAEGYNVLTIAVKDRFGGVRKEVREVVYKPE